MKEPTETGPSRFDLGNDEVVRERLKTLQSTVREMQEKRPEVVSFLMYGSMVKGYATGESDIDGQLIVDTDTASKELGRPVDVEIFYRPMGMNDELDPGTNLAIETSTVEMRFKPDMKAAYEKWTKECFKERIPELTDEQLDHLHALPISIEALDTLLKTWRTNMLKPSEDNILMSEYLSQLFFLDVGNGGMREYRQHVIKKLFSFGQLGHEMWRRIIGFTEIMERKVQDLSVTGDLTDVRYPRTLDDAKKIYG